MNFNDNKPIYLQIADIICTRIINGNYTDKIPGIREAAAELQVNPNTVQRSYDFLEGNGIIQLARGVGYFIHERSVKEIKKYKKEDFLRSELPDVFKSMDLLDMDEKEILRYYQLYKQKKFPK